MRAESIPSPAEAAEQAQRSARAGLGGGALGDAIPAGMTEKFTPDAVAERLR